MNTSPDDTPAAGQTREIPGGLAPIDEKAIERIESRVFAGIAHDRTATRARRGRWWIGGAAAAAVVVVAAAMAPMIVPLVSGSSVSATDEAASAPAFGPESAGSDSNGGADTARDMSELDAASVPQEESTAGRDIITTASATVVVDDVTQAAGDIAASAEAHGGYVESMSIGQTGVVYPVDPNGVVYDSTVPNPYPSPDGAWITVRVPTDQLSAMVDELSGLGEVTARTVNRQDVTEQTVDLQARIDAAQASVDRLLELMTQAGSVSDLIAAEGALAERQATLESYQQQLESLESQIEMSTLSVTLVPKSDPVEADPAGFTDGLAAGWNGLVATLNGIVIALGFLVPWILVAAVIALIVWGIVRLVKRRRARRASRRAEPVERVEPVEDTTSVE